MFELSLLEWLWTGASVFVASVVRGTAGFGFSLIVTVLLTHVLPPATVIPAVLLWEISASIGHLPFVYKEVDWKSLSWLTLGMLAGTPLGVWILARMDAAPMCLVINGMVAVFAIMLLRGKKPKRSPTAAETTLIGATCGVINGTSANGGPPAILFFLSSPAGVAAGRASLIAYFLMTDTWASLFCWQNGLFSVHTWFFAAAMLPVLALGVMLGSRFFRGLDETKFRRMVLVLLFVIAAVGLVKSVLPYLG
ncbi:MAG: sulfite exporter TauE/SafE family protein [Mailhella sp.]|nr:sulfite exporter TauE/SafE family protein [Mailhella sp.]